MTGIAADIPEAGKCRKYGQKHGWDTAGRQGSASKSSQNRWECKSKFVDILMNNETLANRVNMRFARVFALQNLQWILPEVYGKIAVSFGDL